MRTKSDIKIEQTGGLPIILQILEELNLGKLLDKHFPVHGNWEGSSKGFIVTIWIAYIICTCDDRLSSLEDWVSERSNSLEHLLGVPIRVKDFTDDKLGAILDDFSDESTWADFEASVNKGFIRLYGFEQEVIQIDPTVGKSFRKVTEDSLYQYGHSKQFRKDLPQFKTVLANLAEPNFPLVSMTVSGEKADDGLYIPIIKLARKSIEKRGLLWVGDVKIGALSTRAFIAQEEDYYLSPLSKVQVPDEQLWHHYIEPITTKGIDLQEIRKNEKIIAKGYEIARTQFLDGFEWTERHLVIRSEHYRAVHHKSLHKNIDKAQEILLALNQRKQGKKRFDSPEALTKAIRKIVSKHKVVGLLKVSLNITYQKKSIRAYKGKAARVENKMHYEIQVSLDEAALAQRIATLGWRVYATNKPVEKLSIEDAILLYREEYKIERRIRNLKEEVTRLLPVFLQKENRIVGLINLLVLVLKVIATIEFKVAETLKDRGEELGGIYAGNPKITTARPTISKMMNAFKSFAIVFITHQGQTQLIVPQLKPVQAKILDLIGGKAELFMSLKLKKLILISS